MFLRLYFLTRVEEHDAIVYDIRDNGFLAYVPVYDFKGPVYLEKQGVIRLHPSLLGVQNVKTEGKGEGVGEVKNSDKSDCTKYDRAILDFPDYECRLNRDENDSVKELLVCPKWHRNENYNSGNSGSGSGSGSEGRVLSILPRSEERRVGKEC